MSFIFQGYEQVDYNSTNAHVTELDFSRGRQGKSRPGELSNRSKFEALKHLDNFGRVSRKKFLREPWDVSARESTSMLGLTGRSSVSSLRNSTPSEKALAEDTFLTSNRAMFKDPTATIFREAAVNARKLKPKAPVPYRHDPGIVRSAAKLKSKLIESEMTTRALNQGNESKPLGNSREHQSPQISKSGESTAENMTEKGSHHIAKLPASNKAPSPPFTPSWLRTKRQEVSKKITDTSDRTPRRKRQPQKDVKVSPQFLGVADTELHSMTRGVLERAQDIINRDPHKVRGLYKEQERAVKRDMELEQEQRRRHQAMKERQQLLHSMIEEDLKKHTETVLDNPHSATPSREWSRRNSNPRPTTGKIIVNGRVSIADTTLDTPKPRRKTRLRYKDKEPVFFKIP